MESKIVIKVKYGETLRRFIAHIGEDEKMDLDITKLREKIDRFFSFSPERFFTLSYVDEDGDMVALVDEDDLHDVMNQALNPVRITVESFYKIDNKFSDTPLRSPQSDLNSLSNVIKSIPEPFRESFSKISLELVSKAASTGQLISGLVDSISKLGQPLNAESSRNEIPSQKSKIKKTTNKVDTQNTNSGTKGSVNVNDDAQKISGPSGCICKPKATETNATFLTKSRFHIKKDSGIANADSVEDTKFTSYPILNSMTECPFTGTGLSDSGVLTESPFKRSYNKYSSGSSATVFHKGIQCDECGVHPITGPRFKSKSKENYDLCRICFFTFGDDDYIRMDHPVASCPDLSFRGAAFPKQIPKHSFHELLKDDGPSLDSHFVLDINVLDGTVLAPSTPFTKIWRMKNNGNLSWPKGTKLVWIGGDRFSNEDSVETQPITNGLAVDEEINIAVDFCAPEVAGRYLSYWRLATPSGQKFGQRVWVIIEVESALIDPVNFGYNYLNLNLPPVDSETTNIDINMIDGHQNIEPISKTNLEKDQEPHVPAYGSWSVSCSGPPKPISMIHHPLVVDGNSCPVIKSHRFVIGNPETTASFPESHLAPSPLITASPEITIEHTLDNNMQYVEESLLMELEQMGFKKMNLNKEILRKNEYDLQRAIDVLCEVGEWDPILEDLQESGFSDKEMNKRLLKKNKGSIQLVVLDLIYGEKA